MQRTNHQKAFLFMIGFILVICFISQNTALALDTTLAWQKNPAADNVTRYQVYYSTSSFTNSNKPGDLVTVAHDFSDPSLNALFPNVNQDENMIYELTGLPNLTGNQRYYFGVTAVNRPDDTDLESSLSLLVNTVIHNPDDAGTPANAVLTSSDITSSQVVLSWNKPSDDLGVVRFTLTRTGSTLTTMDATTASNYSYTDSTVAADTTYTYRVRSYDAAGHYSNSNEVSVTTESGVITDTTPPSVPGNLASQSVLARSITIRWNASTDNTGGSGIDKYLVYQGSTTSTPVEVDDTGNNTYVCTFDNLQPNTEYTFWVSAIDNAGN
ncbi:MAG: fibronectin type III domain-containing protein [Deltaproteobacteria bacterium]|nr:fibronectin type III domain-containing protein [Deltaproteobacteria bacterium]